MPKPKPPRATIRPDGRIVRRGTDELDRLRSEPLTCTIVNSDDDPRGVRRAVEFAWNLFDQDPQARLVDLGDQVYRIERPDHDLWYLLRPPPVDPPVIVPGGVNAPPKPQIIRRNAKRFAEVRGLNLTCVVVSRDSGFREIPRDSAAAWALFDGDRRAQLLDLGDGTFKIERRPRPMWYLLRPAEAAEVAA